VRITKSGARPPEQIVPDLEPGGVYVAPSALPDGRGVLFNLLGGVDPTAERVAVLDFETGEVKVLLEGAVPTYAPTGHLLFVRGTTLMAAPFDEERLEVTGPAVAVQQGIRHPALVAAGDYGLSEDGTLVFATPEEGGGLFVESGRLVWVDRSGSELGVLEDDLLVRPGQLRLSPDGRRAVVMTGSAGDREMWVYTDGGAPPVRVVEGGFQGLPVWSPDGQRIAYLEDALSTDLGHIVSRRADGKRVSVRVRLRRARDVRDRRAAIGLDIRRGADLRLSNRRSPGDRCVRGGSGRVI